MSMSKLFQYTYGMYIIIFAVLRQGAMIIKHLKIMLFLSFTGTSLQCYMCNSIDDWTCIRHPRIVVTCPHLSDGCLKIITTGLETTTMLTKSQFCFDIYRFEI